MAKPKFNPVFYQNFTTNAKGELTYDDNTWNQINTRNEAIQKIERANQLKLEVQNETNAVILESQKEISQKGNLGMQFLGGVQTYAQPRNWAKGAVGLFNMVTSNVQENIIGGGIAIGEQNAATNLYTQSKDLADQANKIIKTDRPQAEALLKQSQALFEEANKFAGGEATKRIMGADDKLTGKEIFAKSALTGLEVASFLPVGGVAKGSFMLTKTVPTAVQGSKTVVVGNLITRGLGLGDIYQVTKTGVQQGLKQEVQRTVIGQAVTSTFQAPITAGLIEMADDDGVNNYWGSLTTTAAGAFGLTLGFGYAGRVFGSVVNEGVSGVSQQLNKTGVAAVTDLTGALPTPPEPKEQLKIGTTQRLMLPEATQATTTINGQQVGLPTSPYSKLGAFDPNTTIPMVDLTETVKGNNIDFNPDSVLSINSARKVVDDLALLNGNEVGGRKLKINTDDPKYKEVYDTQIKPLIDKINAVDEVAPVNEVSAQQIVEVQNQLDNLKATEQEVVVGLSQDEMQLEALLDELKTHPGKVLHKYANKKEGKLPEITGKGSKYARQGDSIMTELGFTDDDAAQDAYQSWLGLIRQRDSLKANIKESSTFLKDITKEQQTLQKQLEGTQPPIESYDQPQVNKIPAEEVELEVSKIYSTLENEGFNIVPEKVRHTPNIDKVDDKLAKGEQLKPEEFEQGMKEFVNSTGKTEVIDGVQEELTGPMKKSAYVERLNRENPGLDLTSVQYKSAVVKDLKAVANDLIENNFDEAAKIARNINANSNLQEIKTAELYHKKLIELGKYDELSQVYHTFSMNATNLGQKNGILEEKKIGSPQYAIKQAQDIRMNKLKPDVNKEIAKVKQQMSLIAVDQNTIFDILDNITCQ
jgi:hypothetical protein